MWTRWIIFSLSIALCSLIVLWLLLTIEITFREILQVNLLVEGTGTTHPKMRKYKIGPFEFTPLTGYDFCPRLFLLFTLILYTSTGGMQNDEPIFHIPLVCAMLLSLFGIFGPASGVATQEWIIECIGMNYCEDTREARHERIIAMSSEDRELYFKALANMDTDMSGVILCFGAISLVSLVGVGNPFSLLFVTFLLSSGGVVNGMIFQHAIRERRGEETP